MYDILLKFYTALPATGYFIMAMAVTALLLASYTDHLQKQAFENGKIDKFEKRLNFQKVTLILMFMFSGSIIVITGNTMAAAVEKKKFENAVQMVQTNATEQKSFQRKELKPFHLMKNTKPASAATE